VDAVIGAEGAAAAREDFKLAPAAERKVVGAALQRGWMKTAAGEGAGQRHDLRV
jgi:hypothetical protein